MFLHSTTRNGRVIFRPLTDENGICRHGNRRGRSLVTKLRVDRGFHYILTRYGRIEKGGVQIVTKTRDFSLFLRFRFSSIQSFPLSNLSYLRLVRNLGIRNRNRFHVRLRSFHRRLVQGLQYRGLWMKRHTPVLTSTRYTKLTRIGAIQNGGIFYTRPNLQSIFPQGTRHLATPQIRLTVGRHGTNSSIRQLQKGTRSLGISRSVNLRALRAKPYLHGPLNKCTGNSMF